MYEYAYEYRKEHGRSNPSRLRRDATSQAGPATARVIHGLAIVLFCLTLPGCGTVPLQPAGGTDVYIFPEEADLHQPVLVLRSDGRFAFLHDAELAGDDTAFSEFGNFGTYTREGDSLLLRYDGAECCQFMDVESERLDILRSSADTVQVRFRGAIHTLDKAPPARPHATGLGSSER